ncbi:glycoside hydrolase family 3 protein [Lepidopterella palustris CBS 459.81]|uniref:beta-glucosidase n=1 Tax=Lepidopterella palustris CBS 459.81 TaxID=1314670 RepID=A0A8E2EBU5_9PEZI|nr:glycoside hydrolase family 3 protein [Lepidopterella palustris CBS 459.81]
MKSFDIEDTLDQLTLSEKVSLLSGTDFWHTKAIPRLGIPAIRTTDGPNGARGTRFFNGTPAACFPCGTAMGATWDVTLMRTAGELMGKEVKAKGGHVLLGPTVNIQRSPLGGRGFESFSEDPTLSGNIAAAVIQGVQSKGVAATIKHYVCNDQEHDRMGINAIVTERALREIYLKPFQIVQRDAKPRAYMTSYNKVNGTHASESKKLIMNILRKEWEFDGLVMSDWFGVYSSAEAINAGLDLEMPGPPRLRGFQLMTALNSHKVTTHAVDGCVRNVLKFVRDCSRLSILENAPEGTINTPETSKLLREIASSSIVLLKNDNDILPFKRDKRIAVIGPNAKFAAYSGGGSANLRPYYTVTPYDAISEYSEHVEYALGATAQKSLPQMGRLLRTIDGKPGCTMKFYKQPPTYKGREVLEELVVDNTFAFLADWSHPKIDDSLYYADLEGTLTPTEDGIWDFGLAVSGTAQLFVDGEIVVDNLTQQHGGTSFFGYGTTEERGSVALKGGIKHHILVEFGSAPTSNYKLPSGIAPMIGGLNFGGFPRIDPKAEIEKAVKLAKEVDQVVICAGLNSDFEAEGFDRPHMDLPDSVNELIYAVAAANSNTAVVMQSGTPVTMPWISNVNAVLQAWYGGNECGNAIADVLFGAKNPSGKLSLSIPVRCEDSPAFLNSRSERGRALYGEDVYVGYRWYEKTRRDVLFPFGHGLSYTTFMMADLHIHKDEAADVLNVSVQVMNTGAIDGEQVVQVYVSQVAPSVQRPTKELRGFTKVVLKTGQSKELSVKMSLKYATSWWDEEMDMWITEKDTYRVLVGDSSANTPLEGSFEVDKTSWWLGV